MTRWEIVKRCFLTVYTGHMKANTLVKLTVVFLLQGCAYRYGAGTFFVGEDVSTQAPAAYPEPAVASAPQVSAKTDPQCKDDSEETLEVINKLDSKNQTIVTTAKTKRESVRKCEIN
jgi:hypothetical protein